MAYGRPEGQSTLHRGTPIAPQPLGHQPSPAAPRHLISRHAPSPEGKKVLASGQWPLAAASMAPQATKRKTSSSNVGCCNFWLFHLLVEQSISLIFPHSLHRPIRISFFFLRLSTRPLRDKNHTVKMKAYWFDNLEVRHIVPVPFPNGLLIRLRVTNARTTTLAVRLILPTWPN